MDKVNHSQNIYSLYIHWPFCHKKCHYCDFTSLEQHGQYQESYHQALLKEIKTFSAENPTTIVSTIFIGGGTPSLYPLYLLEELFSTLHQHLDCSQLKEVTIESNPTDITEEKLSTWKKLGINRLSMGVQVLDDVVLKNLNRQQRTHDVLNAIKIIPQYFENFSIDLIIGLPGVTEQTWKDTVTQAMSWPIKHISIYFLTIHENTPLSFNIQRGNIKLDDEDATIKLFEETVQTLKNNNFIQYETSNFAQPGFESLHNQAYWNRVPYKGFGLGAASFEGITRTVNEKNLSRYIEKAQAEVHNNVWHREELSKEQELTEIFMLGLRQTKGMDLQRMVYLVSEDKRPLFFEKIKQLKSQNLIKEWDGKISLTTKGLLLENEVIIRLI